MMPENFNPEDPKVTSGKNVSYWIAGAEPVSTQALCHNIETDTVIIGAGIAGLTTAYCLAREGRAVVVLEDGNIGSGETGRTTAHISNAVDDRYYKLEETFGAEKAALIAESHTDAIRLVDQIVAEHQIDCDFEKLNGYLFLHPSDQPESLEKEFAAAGKAGIPVSRAAVPGMLQDADGILFPDQAQFHPLKYLKGLEKVLVQHGGSIYTGTHVSEIDKDGVTTSAGFRVEAKNIVVATNAPVNSRFALPMKQFPYRSYVIGALVDKNTLPLALWWDTGDYEMNPEMAPYHYVRLQKYDQHHDLLIIGGEDHPTGDTSDINITEKQRYTFLEIWARDHFPIRKIVYRWSGQVMEPMDGLAYIGRNPFDHENIYIITGDSGNGMTHCSIGGKIIADLITGRENKYAKLYSPSRFTFSESGIAFKKMFGEFLGYFKQQPNFKSSAELASVRNGEGRIVDMLEEKFGVYRSPEGELHVVSAECTHLKCTVSWNGDEKSWDCPCHGSRFTYDGKVINGPANKNLPCYREFEDQ